MHQRFAQLATTTSALVATAWAFLLALAIILAWGVSGPLFGFSTTWQLVINTGTTIITFLMVFLIQNTQNRAGLATQLKLDELLRAVDAASNRLIDVEDATDEELARLQTVYRRREGRTGDTIPAQPGNGASQVSEAPAPRGARGAVAPGAP